MARTYGPSLRPVRTGVEKCPARTYRPYVRVHFSTPYLRAVHTGIKKCTRTYGPYLPVHTARMYGPYVRVVIVGLNSQRRRRCDETTDFRQLSESATVASFSVLLSRLFKIAADRFSSHRPDVTKLDSSVALASAMRIFRHYTSSAIMTRIHQEMR